MGLFFTGIFFFVTGFFINEWLVKTNKLQINALTVMFFILNFLAATQDIVVDGWALTMLNKFVLLKKKKNTNSLILLHACYIEKITLLYAMVLDKPLEYF